MNVLKRDFLQLAKTLFLAAVITLGTSYIFAAWQEPTAAPPGANAEAPVNVSSTGQIKAGALTLNTIGVGTGLIVDKGTAEIHKDAIIGLSTDAIGALRKILSYGNYWGDKYCDRTGGNCIFPGDTSGNPGYVKQIVAGTNVTISPTTGVGVVTINSSGGGSGTDEKVKVTSADTGARYLCGTVDAPNENCSAGELVAGNGVGFIKNGAGEEWLTLKARYTNSITVDGSRNLQLVGDQSAPANGTFYGISGGVKGWYTPSGGSGADEKVKVTSTDSSSAYLCGTAAAGAACSGGPQIFSGIGGGGTASSISLIRRGADSADQWVEVSLAGDSNAPGNSMYYGTNSTGQKGWFALPGGGSGADEKVKVTSTDSISNYLCVGANGAPCGAGSQIVAGTGITVTRRGADSADQWIEIASSGGGGGGPPAGFNFISFNSATGFLGRYMKDGATAKDWCADPGVKKYYGWSRIQGGVVQTRATIGAYSTTYSSTSWVCDSGYITGYSASCTASGSGTSEAWSLHDGVSVKGTFSGGSTCWGDGVGTAYDGDKAGELGLWQ